MITTSLKYQNEKSFEDRIFQGYDTSSEDDEAKVKLKVRKYILFTKKYKLISESMKFLYKLILILN